MQVREGDVSVSVSALINPAPLLSALLTLEEPLLLATELWHFAPACAQCKGLDGSTPERLRACPAAFHARPASGDMKGKALGLRLCA